MLWRRGPCGSPLLPAGPGCAGEYGGALSDAGHHAPGVSAGDVRERRPAAGKGGEEHHPGQVPAARREALQDREYLRALYRAGGKGGSE